ncbi:ATP-binding protein [Heyndrickxia oleronia]|uniref:ATP-binding protein n=1 Tax=Heyndrickxia oleronia TaxID=38875 RepID=UPI001C0E96F1|nr:ATP-binding protein [Heyndrickxia oleronia]MBU5214388.1 ATP-binding protein [Heyndrickxia oleronia]
MRQNPRFAKRMKDVKESLESNPIQILTSPSDKCPFHKCDGTGWIWIKDWSKRNTNEKDEWQEECECYEQLMKQKEIERKLDLAQVPPIFKDATVNSFDIKRYKKKESRDTAEIARKAATNYVYNFKTMEEHGKGLYLFSEVKGSGKTRLISSVANALVKMYGVDLAFLKADDLLTQIKKTYNDNANTSEDEIVKLFRNVEVLVIDDIAVEKPNEFSERIFFKVLDYRMEHRKVTLFTGNKTIDNLGEVYIEGRVHSRIKKMALEVYMPEESIRDDEAEIENKELEKMLFG